MIWRESYHLFHGILADGQLDRRYQQAPESGSDKAFLAIGGVQSQYPQTPQVSLLHRRNQVLHGFRKFWPSHVPRSREVQEVVDFPP
jgi:hypothetical protein